jgi:Toprim domain
MTDLGLDTIDALTGGRIGQFDVPCPLCSPYRKPQNQRLKVLRIYRIDETFAGYSCVHCGEKGYATSRAGFRPDPEKLAPARAEAAERDRKAAAEQLRKARAIWTCAVPIRRTSAETYLRTARGYHGPLPGTLRFLPARGEHAPAMVAAFGHPTEFAPGMIAIADHHVMGVQITRLAPDGSSKAGGECDKITIGRCRGYPIVLAPPNDLLGVVIAEGAEDALSSHAGNGWGAWAAGGCARMPFLAPAIPSYIECVSIVVDPDPDGERYARELADLVDRRGMEVRLIGDAS